MLRTSLVYQTEKFLADNADKVNPDLKGEVESALGELKTALSGSDVTAIKTATDKVAQASQKLGASMYEQAQAGQATGGPTSGSDAGAGFSSSAASGDEVVDAEIVDEGEQA